MVLNNFTQVRHADRSQIHRRSPTHSCRVCRCFMTSWPFISMTLPLVWQHVLPRLLSMAPVSSFVEWTAQACCCRMNFYCRFYRFADCRYSLRVCDVIYTLLCFLTGIIASFCLFWFRLQLNFAEHLHRPYHHTRLVSHCAVIVYLEFVSFVFL